MKSEHPLQSDNGICFIQKWLPEVLIQLSHWETRRSINSSHLERGRSLMDPQPHPLLHFPVQMIRRPRMFSFRSPKMWKSQGKGLGCTEDVEMFPNQMSEAYPSPDWQYRDGRYQAKGRFRPTAFQGVLTLWRVAASSATKQGTTHLCSSLLASISNTGRTHFTLLSPPEQ